MSSRRLNFIGPQSDLYKLVVVGNRTWIALFGLVGHELISHDLSLLELVFRETSGN